MKSDHLDGLGFRCGNGPIFRHAVFLAAHDINATRILVSHGAEYAQLGLDRKPESGCLIQRSLLPVIPMTLSYFESLTVLIRENGATPTCRPFLSVIKNAQCSRPRLYQSCLSNISRATILACARASLPPASESPSGSAIGLRSRIMILKQYRGIPKRISHRVRGCLPYFRPSARHANVGTVPQKRRRMPPPCSTADRLSPLNVCGRGFNELSADLS
jgi:hypothetical protein